MSKIYCKYLCHERNDHLCCYYCEMFDECMSQEKCDIYSGEDKDFRTCEDLITLKELLIETL